MSEKFDPVTGELKPETAETVNPSGSYKMWMALGAVAVLILVVFAMIKSGVFMSPSEKVLRAAGNTFGYRSHLAEDMGAIGLLMAGDYTMGLEMNMQGMAMEAQYCSSPEEKQLTGGVSIMFLPKVDFIASITPTAFRMQIPLLDERIIAYHYTEEKTGYITELLSEAELEDLDRMLQSVFSEQYQKKAWIETGAALADWYGSLEYEKTEGRKFTVDGKERNCTGYKLSGVDGHMLGLLNELEDIFARNYEGILDDSELEDLFGEWKLLLEEAGNIDMTLYLYKNRIVYAAFNGGGEELQVFIESDKDGNLKVEYVGYGETILRMERRMGDSTEQYLYHLPDFDMDGYNVGDMDMAFEYDYKSGEFSLEMDAAGYDYAVNGSLESDTGSVTIRLDSLELDGEWESMGVNAELYAELYVEKGVSMQEMEGEEVDLGNLSESGWMDLEEAFSLY